MDYQYKFEKYKSKYEELLKQKAGAQTIKNVGNWAYGSETSKMPGPKNKSTLKIEFVIYNDKNKDEVFRKIKENKRDKKNSDYITIEGDVSYNYFAAMTSSTENWYIVPKGGLSAITQKRDDYHYFDYVRIPELLPVGKDSMLNVLGTTEFDEFDIRKLFYTIKSIPGKVKRDMEKHVVTYKNGWTFYANTGIGLKKLGGQFKDIHKGDKVVGILTSADEVPSAYEANKNGEYTDRWKKVMEARNSPTLSMLLVGNETNSNNGTYPMYYKDHNGKTIYDEVYLYEGNRATRVLNRVSENLDYFNLLSKKTHDVRSNGSKLMTNLVLQENMKDNELRTNENYSWITMTELDLDNCSGCQGFTANLVLGEQEGPKIYGVLGTHITKRTQAEVKDQQKVDSDTANLAEKCSKVTTMEEYERLGCDKLEGKEQYLETIRKNIEKDTTKNELKQPDPTGLSEINRKLVPKPQELDPGLDLKKRMDELKKQRQKVLADLGSTRMDNLRERARKERENEEKERKAQEEVDKKNRTSVLDLGKKLGKTFVKNIKDKQVKPMNTMINSSLANQLGIKAGEYHASEKKKCGDLKGKYKVIYCINKYNGRIKSQRSILDCDDNQEVYVSKFQGSLSDNYSKSSSSESEDNNKNNEDVEYDEDGLALWKPLNKNSSR